MGPVLPACRGRVHAAASGLCATCSAHMQRQGLAATTTSLIQAPQLRAYLGRWWRAGGSLGELVLCAAPGPWGQQVSPEAQSHVLTALGQRHPQLCLRQTARCWPRLQPAPSAPYPSSTLTVDTARALAEDRPALGPLRSGSLWAPPLGVIRLKPSPALPLTCRDLPVRGEWTLFP